MRVPGATLATISSGHTSVVIGNYVYLIGGLNNSGLNGVGRSTINADGSLGLFATVPVALATARYAHTSAVIGHYLYVIGGGASNTALNTVERTTINADGSLGLFTAIPSVTLVTARNAATSAMVGNYLYILGGFGSSVLNNVERARINPDGSLGPFTTVSGVTLVTPRYFHSSAVIGNCLYVFGGIGPSILTSVERATINVDGSLGPFATVSGVNLVTARYGATSAVVGRYLYIVGGASSTTILSSIEQAPINVDGSLGTFAIVSVTTLVVARYSHTNAVVGSYLYVVGGPAGDTERAMINTDQYGWLTGPVCDPP